MLTYRVHNTGTPSYSDNKQGVCTYDGNYAINYYSNAEEPKSNSC